MFSNHKNGGYFCGKGRGGLTHPTSPRGISFGAVRPRGRHPYGRYMSYQGTLSTNAKKVTVSVLYWYEKLSSHLDWNFWNDSEKNQKLLFYFTFFSASFGLGGLGVGKKGSETFQLWPPLWVTTMPIYRRLHHWVRPYLVESTTSRPICEVKQLQA